MGIIGWIVTYVVVSTVVVIVYTIMNLGRKPTTPMTKREEIVDKFINIVFFAGWGVALALACIIGVLTCRRR